MSLSFILLFTFTVFVASIIPGPSMLLALTHGIQHGVKKTTASALGNVTVTLIQASISIAGLGTILITSHTVFLVIKWAGAAYLVYMGIMMILSSRQSFSPQNNSRSFRTNSVWRMFLQAAMVTAGNPKAIIFFSAVFPQFINEDAPYLYQSCVLMSIVAIIAFTCFMIYAVGGRRICSLFSKADASRLIKRAVGSTFIGAGIGLASSH